MNTKLASPVLIPSADWAQLRQRVQSPSFSAAMNRLRQDVVSVQAMSLTAPDEPAGHYHHFFCPAHGIELTFDPQSPRAHRCPVDGVVFGGPPYDAAWRWFVNNRLSQWALHLGVLWQLEGDPAHAAKVTDILAGYAHRYEGYRSAPHTGPQPGIATFQTLDEAVWILPLAWAFDLTRSTMSDSAAEMIVQQLLIPVAEFLIDSHYGGIHNFACWHNAAIATVGAVTDRRDLVEFATDGEFGLGTQLSEGVLSDGLWFEGSFSYHYYALAAVFLHLKATSSRQEFDRREHPAVRLMLETPILCEYPDGTLPATNDCWYFTGLLDDVCHGVPSAPAFYEVAYFWYGDSRFAQVLQRAYQHGPRDSLDALLYGPDVVPVDEMTAQVSVHLTASGYAILRTVDRDDGGPLDANEQSYILLKHGLHGGGHGHPDKLNLILYAHGQRLSADLGTPGYGLDLFESWYRHTLSHDTMTIDGRSQPPAMGRIIRFKDKGEFQVADAAVTWTEGDYAGVDMRRVILARSGYFLDICVVSCDRPRRIEWVYHNTGALRADTDLGPFIDASDNGDAYEHLAGTRKTVLDDDVVLSWSVSGAGLKLFSAHHSRAELLTATAPGYPPTETRSVVINRRHAAHTVYLSVFHPFSPVESVNDVRWPGTELIDEGWAGCVLQTSRGPEAWLIRMSSMSEPPSRDRHATADRIFDYCLE